MALPAAANDDVTLAANDADTPIDIALATAQSATNALGDNAVPPDSSRHDKKAGGGKDPDGDNLVTTQAQPPAQVAQIPFDPAIVQPVPQVAVQIPGVAEDDGSIDAASPVPPGIAAIPQNIGSLAMPAPSANKNPNGSQPAGDGPADPRTSPQLTPADDNADPVSQSPAPNQVSATDGDDGTDVATGNSPNLAITGKDSGPAARNKIGDGKPAANNSISSKTASKQPIDPNAASQIMPAMDDDAEPATQNGISAPPAANAPDQTASTTGGAAGALARMVNAAQVPAARPATRDAMQVDKPVQTASNIANGPQPVTTPGSQGPATTGAAGGKNQLPGDNPIQAASSGNTDGKPVHAAPSDTTPQPDASLPVVHAATPANGQPPGLMTINPTGTNIPDGAANAMVTASVHIAAAGATAAPDTDALAVTIAARSLSGAKQFEIRLDPPELGHVEVRLSIDASGKTQAHMTADQPQTLDLLRKDAPALTLALREAGLDVSQSGLNFSLRGQDRQAGDRNNGTGQGRRTNLTATRAINAAQGTAAISFNGAAADARVDIHV